MQPSLLRKTAHICDLGCFCDGHGRIYNARFCSREPHLRLRKCVQARASAILTPSSLHTSLIKLPLLRHRTCAQHSGGAVTPEREIFSNATWSENDAALFRNLPEPIGTSCEHTNKSHNIIQTYSRPQITSNNIKMTNRTSNQNLWTLNFQILYLVPKPIKSIRNDFKFFTQVINNIMKLFQFPKSDSDPDIKKSPPLPRSNFSRIQLLPHQA